MDSGATICLLRPDDQLLRYDTETRPVRVKTASGQVIVAVATGQYSAIIRQAAVMPNLEIGLLSMKYLRHQGIPTVM
jgi:hypothetical protein